MIRRPPRSTLFPTRRSSDLAQTVSSHRLTRTRGRRAASVPLSRTDGRSAVCRSRPSTRPRTTVPTGTASSTATHQPGPNRQRKVRANSRRTPARPSATETTQTAAGSITRTVRARAKNSTGSCPPGSRPWYISAGTPRTAQPTGSATSRKAVTGRRATQPRQPAPGVSPVRGAVAAGTRRPSSRADISGPASGSGEGRPAQRAGRGDRCGGQGGQVSGEDDVGLPRRLHEAQAPALAGEQPGAAPADRRPGRAEAGDRPEEGAVHLHRVTHRRRAAPELHEEEPRRPVPFAHATTLPRGGGAHSGHLTEGGTGPPAHPYRATTVPGHGAAAGDRDGVPAAGRAQLVRRPAGGAGAGARAAGAVPA